MEDRQAAVFLLVVSPAIGVWDDVRAITKTFFGHRIQDYIDYQIVVVCMT